MRWWRTCVGAVIAVAVACGAPSVAAGQLTPSPDPLPGSTFQGADGDQVDEGEFVDWEALDEVVHSEDDNALDTAFAGGTKEGEPALWAFDRQAGGVTPGKSNILDAWSSVDQTSGRTFLYLAFTREASTGETFLTFELNQAGGTWKNDNGVRIPCRRDGDILISYEISGNVADVFLRRWRTGVTDPTAGCDRTGTIVPFGRVRAGVNAQGAINRTPIDNHLPGILGGEIPPLQFGEAALDLDALLGPAFTAGCYAFRSIWMHSRSSTAYTSDMKDFVAPTPIALRTCAAEGEKFFDLDADGVRDPGEPGLPGFQIYADYDNDGHLDPGEPSTVTDRAGRYVLYDIRREEYWLRERLLPTRRAQTNRWLCSFPHAGTDGGFGGAGLGFPCGWGPIDATLEPNATGRDFGNWYPAQLTVVKDLVPADDLGRFDLFVNDDRVLQNAGDGASVRLAVPPGRYTVTERAVPPASLDQYTVTPYCKLLSRQARAGSDSASVELAAGGRATCGFVNVRLGQPAIRIDKSGPSVAAAGDTLRYTLRVTNPGLIPFAAEDVTVTDPTCDDPPELVDKADGSGSDGSPGTLDHGDVWTYECSLETDEPGEDCVQQIVRNTATATGAADGTTVKWSSTIETTLTCPETPPPDPPDPTDPPVPPDPPDPAVPPQPDEPIPPTPVVPGLPDEPGAVRPSVPRPPAAGRAGVAGLARTRLGRCVIRLPRMAVRGTLMSRVSVFLDGRRVRVLRSTPLQRRLTIRRLGRSLPAGRHTVAVRVRFRLGSGTRPLRLARRVAICRAVLPRFTG